MVEEAEAEAGVQAPPSAVVDTITSKPWLGSAGSRGRTASMRWPHWMRPRRSKWSQKRWRYSTYSGPDQKPGLAKRSGG
jgi:hypothetical protein